MPFTKAIKNIYSSLIDSPLFTLHPNQLAPPHPLPHPQWQKELRLLQIVTCFAHSYT